MYTETYHGGLPAVHYCLLLKGERTMDKFYSTEEAAKLAGLKLVTFNQRARRNEIKPADFAKNGKKALWTMAQIDQIKNLRGNKRTQPKEQPTVVEDTLQESAQVTTSTGETNADDKTNDAPIVEHAEDTAQIITLEERADRIRKLQADVQRGIIQIGFELIAAKNEIGHGGWTDWLATNFDWTQQTANRFMRVSERFGKLNNVVQFKPSTLQAMLALPEGDEQAFIAEQAESGKPLENQSAREVQASVKQWKKKRAEETTTDTLQAENNSPEEVKGTYFDLRGNDENSSVVEELNRKTINTAVITSEQLTAIRNLIDNANDLQTVKAIRDSLLKLAQEIGEIVLLTEAKIGELQKNTTDDGGANGLN